MGLTSVLAYGRESVAFAAYAFLVGPLLENP